MKLRIALTGGIGSGKSTAARLFATLGITIIDADVIAYKLTLVDSPLFLDIKQHFGAQILTADQQLDRAQLRKIIFQDLTQKTWLERLLHPHIRKTMRQEINLCTSPYCILVIPLLTEAVEPIDFIDRICVVDCPESLQIERAAARDHLSAEYINNIIAHQSSRQQRLALADDIIVNDGNLEKLTAEVKKLHSFYLQLADNK